nr:transcription elongation factor GreA [Maliibacterium massiliense]
MAQKEVILTPEGLAKLEEKLEYLKTVKRHEVAQRIKAAIAFGDLSENSEYDEAKNEQAFLEGEIQTIENRLRVARVVDEEDMPADTVSVGSIVDVYDADEKEDVRFTICGVSESEPAKGKISNESPIGRALIGHKVGELVEVQVPAGTLHFEIKQIGR